MPAWESPNRTIVVAEEGDDEDRDVAVPRDLSGDEVGEQGEQAGLSRVGSGPAGGRTGMERA